VSTWTDVVLKCGCGRRWEHQCTIDWTGKRGIEGQASTWSTESPEPLVVRAILGLPARLKAHRQANDLSMREAAKRIGISFSTVHRIEHGEDYTVDSLLAVAAYLDGVS